MELLLERDTPPTLLRFIWSLLYRMHLSVMRACISGRPTVHPTVGRNCGTRGPTRATARSEIACAHSLRRLVATTLRLPI